MNLLVDPAPTVYTLGDKEYPLNTSFRFGILFEQMMLDDALSNREKGLAALELFFPGILPTGENEAGLRHPLVLQLRQTLEARLDRAHAPRRKGVRL